MSDLGERVMQIVTWITGDRPNPLGDGTGWCTCTESYPGRYVWECEACLEAYLSGR